MSYSYKPAYIWNGTTWDQIGNQAVASLDDYALLDPALGQIINNTTLTSASLTSASIVDADIAGAVNISANVNVFGRLDLQEVRETVNPATISASVLTADYSTGTIFYVSSSAASNFTVNVTNVPTDNDKAITVVIVLTQGATGRIPSALQVDGNAQTIKWLGGNAPTPTSGAGKIDIFNFTLIRTGSAWLVLANSSLNF
jgi:hypothetical protein